MINKLIIVALVILPWFLLLSKINLDNHPSNTSPNEQPNSHPTTNPSPSPAFAVYKPYYSVDGQYYAYLDTRGTDQLTSLILQTKSHDYTVIDGDKNPIAAIPNLNNFIKTNDYLRWAPNNTALALSLPDKIVVYKFSYHNKTLTKTDEHTIPVVNQTPFHPNSTIFSGDSNELFYRSNNQYYRYDIAANQIDPLPKTVLEPYPIPNSPGYLFWDNQNGEKPDRIGKAVAGHLDYWSIPEEVSQSDYQGAILLSPKHNYACIETGSSGYWGYQIVNLNNQMVVASGVQYSYCNRWLNPNQVVVKEKYYFTQDIEQYYLIDASSGTIRLLH